MYSSIVDYYDFVEEDIGAILIFQKMKNGGLEKNSLIERVLMGISPK